MNIVLPPPPVTSYRDLRRLQATVPNHSPLQRAFRICRLALLLLSIIILYRVTAGHEDDDAFR